MKQVIGKKERSALRTEIKNRQNNIAQVLRLKFDATEALNVLNVLKGGQAAIDKLQSQLNGSGK